MPNLSVTAERTKAYVLCTRTSRDVTQWIGERSQGGQIGSLLRKLRGLYTVGSKTIAMFEGFGLSAMQRLI